MKEFIFLTKISENNLIYSKPWFIEKLGPEISSAKQRICHPILFGIFLSGRLLQNFSGEKEGLMLKKFNNNNIKDKKGKIRYVYSTSSR